MRKYLTVITFFLFFVLFFNTQNVTAESIPGFKTYSTKGLPRSLGINIKIQVPIDFEEKKLLSPSIIFHFMKKGEDNETDACTLIIKPSSVQANESLSYVDKNSFEYKEKEFEGSPMRKVTEFQKVNFKDGKQGIYLMAIEMVQFAQIITFREELYYPFRDKLIEVNCGHVIPKTLAKHAIQHALESHSPQEAESLMQAAILPEAKKFLNNQHKIFLKVLNSLSIE